MFSAALPNLTSLWTVLMSLVVALACDRGNGGDSDITHDSDLSHGEVIGSLRQTPSSCASESDRPMNGVCLHDPLTLGRIDVGCYTHGVTAIVTFYF